MHQEFVQERQRKNMNNNYIERGTVNRRQGMNLYQESSEEEEDSYEESEEEDEERNRFERNYEQGAKKINNFDINFDESQLVDQSTSRIKELSEDEDDDSEYCLEEKPKQELDEEENNEEKSFQEDFQDILDNMSPSDKNRQVTAENTPLKNMKISNIKNLQLKQNLFMDSMNAGKKFLKSITKTRPMEKLETKAYQEETEQVMKLRKGSHTKHGLYYSNEKPDNSKMFIKSYDNLDAFDDNWGNYDEINDSKILYADDMNSNLQLKASNFLDNLEGKNNKVKIQTRKYMNVLLVGKAFRGKSDLLKQIFLDAFGRRVELKAEKIKKGNFELIPHERKTRECINNFTFTDSRGFLSGLSVEKWFGNIKGYFDQCMNEYYHLQCMVDKDPGLKFKEIVDGRIHLCLYLLQFPRLSPNDYIYLKKLESHVNVLPIVVIKAEDQNRYSLSEIEKMKKDMYLELIDLNMDCLQWSQRDGIISSFEKKLIGKSFPAIVQLRDLKDEINRKRSYNSDFHILLKMMLNPYISVFQLKTEQYYTARIPKLLKSNKGNEFKKKKEKDNQDNSDDGDEDEGKLGFGAGVAVGLGIIGAFMAFKNKLF
jgi:hypothetical protein